MPGQRANLGGEIVVTGRNPPEGRKEGREEERKKGRKEEMKKGRKEERKKSSQ